MEGGAKQHLLVGVPVGTGRLCRNHLVAPGSWEHSCGRGGPSTLAASIAISFRACFEWVSDIIAVL